MEKAPKRQSSFSLPEALEARLVIALDYGTTYTGVAYALTTETRADLMAIKTISDWGNGMTNVGKIPSVISYSKGEGPQWGERIDARSIAMVHTKLQLELRTTSHELDYCRQALEGMNNLDFQKLKEAGSMPPYPVESPEVIVEDFLFRMFNSLRTVPRSFNSGAFRNSPVDIVATIPASWSYEAKNSLYRAFTRAGFNQVEFPGLSNVWLISEPEAAAIFTARSLNLADLSRGYNEQKLREKECFVLCDAGGGTVDVVSYQVKQLQPKFEITRVTRPSSENCGSIFINDAFKTWLREILGDNYHHLDEIQPRNGITSFDHENENMRELMENFNINKHKFKHGYRDMHIKLPGPLKDMDFHPHGQRRGHITVTYEKMVSFFEPLMSTIIELIKIQLQQIKNSTGLKKRCRNVFLVGGFAESQYLQESLTTALKQIRQDTIQVQKADKPLTAVVRGAAIVGIEKLSNCRMEPCPQSYGIAIDEQYSPIFHHADDRVADADSKTVVAKDQLKWLIKKGDLMLSTEPKMRQKTITVTFEEYSPKTGRIPVYSFDYEDLPERLGNALDEVTQIRLIEYTLENIPLSEFPVTQVMGAKPVYTAALDLTMQLDTTSLWVQLAYRKRILYKERILLPDERERELDRERERQRERDRELIPTETELFVND